MSKDNYTSMFSRKIEIIQIFFNARGKNSLRTAYNLPCNIFSLSAFWYELWTNKYFTSSLTTTKRCHLKLNFKRGLIVVDVRFENLGISLGWYLRISHSLARGYSDAFRPIAWNNTWLDPKAWYLYSIRVLFLLNLVCLRFCTCFLVSRIP